VGHQLRLRSALELLHAGTQQMEERQAHELMAGPSAVTVTPSPASASANVLSSGERVLPGQSASALCKFREGTLLHVRCIL